ncbi:MAG: OB-fold domain-containing protein, partial [Chloroflexi bacterium]|nr:OB-fold domain-containing protein [Chloroflexota bacterium]
EVPYVTAYIDLAEGDRMLTVLKGVDPNDPESIEIGGAVQIEFEEASEDVHIPFWRPV